MSELNPSLPFTLSHTHLHTLLQTQAHYSTICRHCLRASSEERAQCGAGLAARGPWGLSPPICPFPLRPTLCFFNCVVYLSFHPGLGVESMTLETLKARLCLEYVYLTTLLSHRAVFLGSSIRQLRGLKKATNINIHAAKICPMVWSVDSTCREKRT